MAREAGEQQFSQIVSAFDEAGGKQVHDVVLEWRLPQRGHDVLDVLDVRADVVAKPDVGLPWFAEPTAPAQRAA